MSRLKDVMRGELIGARCRLIEARDPSQRGLTGVIMNETKNTFTLQLGNELPFEACNSTDGMLKIIPKFGTMGEISPYEGDGGIRVDFSDMRFRPEDRIKRLRR